MNSYSFLTLRQKRKYERICRYLKYQQGKNLSQIKDALMGAAVLTFLSAGQSEDKQLFSLGYSALVFGGIAVYNAAQLTRRQIVRNKITSGLENL